MLLNNNSKALLKVKYSISPFCIQQFLKEGLTTETTMDATDGYSQLAMGQRTILSFFDAKTVNMAYCSGKIQL